MLINYSLEVDMNWFNKAWALLHDPPYKALWPLDYKPLDGRIHEEEARALLAELLKGTKLGGGAPDEKTSRTVAGADRLASSFDRWALAPEGEAKYWVRPERLINPFNPNYSADIEVPPFDQFVDQVKAFVREINGVVKNAPDEREAYFALFAVYELAWIKAGLPALPADTRMPTHTIFDHLYATASVMNWVGEEGAPKEDGCLVEIDVPGIQRVISSARKAGDYRAGSLLVSLAVWGTAWKYMELYGPDVLLSPSPRFNPFLYLQLSKEYGWGQRALSLYGTVVSKFLGLEVGKVEDFVRLAPVVPGTAYLALPNCAEAERAVDYFEEVLDDIKAMVLGEGDARLPLGGAASGDVLKVAKAVLGKMPRRYLPLRVRYASISEARGLAEKAARAVGERAGFEVDPVRFIFWALMKKLKEKPAVPRPVSWFDRGGAPKFAKLYNGPWIYSSLDPDQPAALKISGVVTPQGVDYDEEAKRAFAGMGVENLAELIKVFKPKKALGPVDVLKRALYLAVSKGVGVESVEAVALKWHYQQNYFNNCPDLRSKVEEVLHGGDAEVIFGSSEAADKALAEAPRLCGGDPAAPPPTLMYAIIRADADNVGKLISGCLPAAPSPPSARLLESREDAERQWREDKERFAKLVEAVQILGAEAGCGGEGGRGVRYIIPSPAYYAALSASMMLTALKDVYIASLKYGGEVVFAGGDDLLAFSPLATAFDIVRETREAYWGDGGFHKIGAYALPALAAYGKSYSVRAAHSITDFMAVEVEEAARLLEKAKDSVEGKDALAVSTSTGHAGYVKVGQASLLKAVADAYRSGALSKNLPYDLERWAGDGFKCEDSEACREAALALFAYVARRNVKAGGEELAQRLAELLELKAREGGAESAWRNATEVLKAVREWA